MDHENTPLLNKPPLTPKSSFTSFSSTASPSKKANKNYYFLPQSSNEVSATVADLINPLGEGGEPNKEEIIHDFPQDVSFIELFSRPVVSRIRLEFMICL